MCNTNKLGHWNEFFMEACMVSFPLSLILSMLGVANIGINH